MCERKYSRKLDQKYARAKGIQQKVQQKVQQIAVAAALAVVSVCLCAWVCLPVAWFCSFSFFLGLNSNKQKQFCHLRLIGSLRADAPLFLWKSFTRWFELCQSYLIKHLNYPYLLLFSSFSESASLLLALYFLLDSVPYHTR